MMFPILKLKRFFTEVSFVRVVVREKLDFSSFGIDARYKLVLFKRNSPRPIWPPLFNDQNPCC